MTLGVRRRIDPGAGAWIALAAITVLGLTARVLIATLVPLRHILDPDSPGYLQPGLALARHARFTWGPTSHVPEIVRTPGYPLFLAALSHVVGTSARSLAIAQAVLSAFTGLGVFALARRWFGSTNVAVLAAALAVFEPLQLWASAEILTEALSAASYVVVALLATSAARSGSPRRWALVGIALAAATYIRPTTYYFGPVLAVLLFAALARRTVTGRHWRRAAAGSLAVLLPFVALVGPWQWRNHDQTGTWRFSAVEAVNMFEYRAAAVVAQQTGRSFSHAKQTLDYFFIHAHEHERQGVYYDHMYDEGLRVVRKYPGALAITTARGTVSMIFGVKHVLLTQLGIPENGPINALAEAGLVAFYALAAVGITNVVRRQRASDTWPAHVLVFALIAYTIVAAGNPRSDARLRAPLMPLLCPYVALGIAVVARRLGDRERGVPVP